MPRTPKKGDGRTSGGYHLSDGEHDHTPHSRGEHNGAMRLRERRASRYIASTPSRDSTSLDCEHTTRQKVWQFLNSSLLEEGPRQVWAKRFEYFCAGLIFLNVLADILDSVPAFPFTEDHSPSFRVLERFSCVVFTCEYLLRAWSCVESSSLGVGSNCMKRLRFMTSVMPLLDLTVLVVFYLDIFMSSDATRGFQSLRVIRTLRLLALLKMERQTQSFQTVFRVFSRRRSDLAATLFLAMTLLVMASTAMYYLEVKAEPDQFPSIPATMWWCTAAMTTVGYGDLYPNTVSGKVLASVVAFLGVGFFALPSGIVSSGFVELLQEQRQADAEDLAELMDEDKASIDELHGTVQQLTSQLDVMQGKLRSAEDDAFEAKRHQKHVLELVQRLAASREGQHPP